MPRRHRRLIRSRIAGAAVLLLAVGAGGCTDAGPVERSPSASTAADPTPGSSIGPSPGISDALAMAMAGPWRNASVAVDRGLSSRLDATCRAAEPAIGDAQQVVVDARGDRQVTLIFADPSEGPAYVCRATVDATTAAEVAVIEIDRPAEPIGDTGIDALLYEQLTDQDGTRTILVGRIGTRASDSILQFADESFVFGSERGGWYTMWWPGVERALSVAAVDTRNAVIGEVDL
jgi:hypothetical protein